MPARRKRAAETTQLFYTEIWKEPQRENNHWVLWWFDSIYRQNYYVIWPASPKQRQEFAAKHFGVPAGDIDERFVSGNCATVEYTINEKPFSAQLISFPAFSDSAIELAAVAHEAMHATEHVFKERGLSLDVGSEHCTYHVQYIAEQIIEAMRWGLKQDRKARRGRR